MFGQISEQTMHRVRWVLTCGWLLLIFSLFYDPISPILTDPSSTWSPLRINPDACVAVQGVCLEEQPYRVGASIFWGAIVPASIFVLLVFGHELWRRICPLSFLSQIPVALKWQRQKKRVDAKTGRTRYEIVKIKKESWLGRNHLYFQFGWLYVGLCARILFVNSDRTALAAWLLFTIGAAIAVGYLYGGKSWCQYFCPMAPVQKIYAEPGGVLASKAHMDDRQITQSMCRIVNDEGKEQSACVACKSPCIDIDAERSYWDGLGRPDHTLLYYGYFGLVVGYFLYYYLYAGNWNYYFSGAWAHQENQLATLLDPGFYLLGRSIPIPKLIAVPLTIGAFGWGSYALGSFIEKRYKAQARRNYQSLTNEQIQHRLFTLCTFIVFNLFFVFGGRPFILLLPLPVQYLYEGMIISISTLWLYRTWRRSPEMYSRESLASRFRKQLSRLNLNISRFVEGRSLDNLNTHEVYVLAKVLPGFTKEKRHDAYKGVLRESLEEGYVNTYSSLEVLQQLRSELDISDQEHREVLAELGVEDPELLNPTKLRNRENLVRLTGYQKALERLLTLQQRSFAWKTDTLAAGQSIHELLEKNSEAIWTLRREYSITPQEEAQILAGFDQATGIVRRAEFLLDQLRNLVDRYRALNQPILLKQAEVLTLLRTTVQQQKRLLVRGLLEILEQLGETAEATRIAELLNQAGSTVLQDLIDEQPVLWRSRLTPSIITALSQPGQIAAACPLDLEAEAIADHLEALTQEPNSLIQAISLYTLYRLNKKQGQRQALQLLEAQTTKPLVRETAEIILTQSEDEHAALTAFGTLEKLVHLSNSDFFSGTKSETLIELANRSSIKLYGVNDVITEEGDTCRELLLLIEGEAQIEAPQQQKIALQNLVPGQILDELEVLSHAEQVGTIVAKATVTRILAIPVDTFDDLLDQDSDFARRVLEMESRRLQQLIYQNQPTSPAQQQMQLTR
ncbi:MAG: cyclic nucleotide-binding domain-containing protein [Leptolyngbyaceae cyanobacterium SL_5_9]|nr:cyclic nucleotide-binding domain-containing protein [Leptolyngbyaceae cyanobacterium SL_5_9]NJO76043.1 cyclic nucleotide-binding domain-containing protein [Leptolyngbyaceae cyanobacterium RM1_406_9]